jgi:hypothetical protein
VKSYPPMLVSSGVLAPAGGAPSELAISYVLTVMKFLPRCRFKPARALAQPELAADPLDGRTVMCSRPVRNDRTGDTGTGHTCI